MEFLSSDFVMYLWLGRRVEVKILTEILDENEAKKYKDADGKPIDRIVFAVVVSAPNSMAEQIMLLAKAPNGQASNFCGHFLSDNFRRIMMGK